MPLFYYFCLPGRVVYVLLPLFSTATSFVGYIILATSVQKSVGAAYFALFLVVGGNYSLFPLVMCVLCCALPPSIVF
jgi:hypothetical protein